jgi:hypothetical protein
MAKGYDAVNRNVAYGANAEAFFHHGIHPRGTKTDVFLAIIEISADVFCKRIGRSSSLMGYNTNKVAVNGKKRTGKATAGNAAGGCEYCYGFTDKSA